MRKERIESYIHSLDRPLPEYLQRMETEARKNYVPVVKTPTQGLLAYLLEDRVPNQILEVGTAIGFSSLFMAEHLPEQSKIITIEKLSKRAAMAREAFLQQGRETQITLLEGEAKDHLLALRQKNASFDLVFMDAAKGQYLPFLTDMEALVTPGGLLLSDNVLQDNTVLESRYSVPRRDRTIHERMREYLYVLTHSPKWNTLILPIGDGVALSTRRKEPSCQREEK